MATVVNARDVILQAALPNGRVAGVTMQPNIAVDPSQVTGLGLIIAGTKTVDLETSSQVFQVATSGTATPSAITLTLNLRNVVGTPSISIISGSYTGGLPALTGGPAVYTASIAYANLTTDTITIRASVTESSITYTDDVTLIKARDGVNAVNAFLTNEAHTVPSSDTGVVSSYTGAGGTFKVYQGSTDVSASCTYAVQSNPNSLTTSINSTSGVFSVTAGFAGGIDTATVTYRATFGAQTFDKVFTITKSKAGVNGSAGARGSRTFYVSGITSWSDATATSTASVSGGPIVNDVVTQYDSSAGFSQTRFWTGTVWTIVAAVVDGSLLVSGTVGAAAIAAGAIRTSHLLVTGGAGMALNGDPTCRDTSAWNFFSASMVTLTDGVAGQGAIRCVGDGRFTSLTFPLIGGKSYKLSFAARKLAGATGLMYVRLHTFNAAGTELSYANYDVDTGAAYEGVALTTTFTRYNTFQTVPAGAMSGFFEIYTTYNGGGTGGNGEVQDVRLEEQLDYSTIILGGLKADRIDTRGLTIKDTAGNIVFSSGTSLPADAATAGGWNPQFNDWTGTYPVGWTDWSSGGLIVKETSIVRTGPYAVRFPTGGNSAVGIVRAESWATAPKAVGTFLQGSVDVYIVTDSGGGLPGLLIRLWNNSALTTDVTTIVNPTTRATGVWHRVPFTARVAAGQQIYGLQIYQMAAWTGMPGGSFNGTVIFDNLTFDFCDASTDNSAVSISSGGVLSGAGGGTVTIGGLDSTVVRSANPINSGNVGTYIADATIGEAKILGTLNANKITAGTITTDRLVTNAATVSAVSLESSIFVSMGSSDNAIARTTSTAASLTSTGAPVTVIITGYYSVGVTSASVAAIQMLCRLDVDGSVVSGIGVAFASPVVVFGGLRNASIPVSVSYRFTPTAGTHTYALRFDASILNSSGSLQACGAGSSYAGSINIIATENKV